MGAMKNLAAISAQHAKKQCYKAKFQQWLKSMLTPIKESCNLTELENNLIAQNINFQYIFNLKKSRWAATKKQMISIPVTSTNVLNTIKQLPRLPSEAGLILVESTQL